MIRGWYDMPEDIGEIEKLFIGLYDEYYGMIYNFIYRGVRRRETAEDLTAEVFFKALRYIKKNGEKIRNYKSWFFKIATNEILMHHRYHRGKIVIQYEDEEEQSFLTANDDRLNFAGREIDLLAVRQALLELKPLEKTIIELRYFEGMEYEEVAGILSMKESTIRSLVHRALEKLKLYFKGCTS
jgi:RNA polymerase sigma-70 factor (ECF subfamily)